MELLLRVGNKNCVPAYVQEALGLKKEGAKLYDVQQLAGRFQSVGLFKLQTDLVFVRIVRKMTFGHRVRDEGIAPYGGHVGPNYGQHFGDEAVGESAQTSRL